MKTHLMDVGMMLSSVGGAMVLLFIALRKNSVFVSGALSIVTGRTGTSVEVFKTRTFLFDAETELFGG